MTGLPALAAGDEVVLAHDRGMVAATAGLYTTLVVKVSTASASASAAQTDSSQTTHPCAYAPATPMSREHTSIADRSNTLTLLTQHV